MKEDIFDPWYFYSKRYKHWGWLYILLLLIPIFIILAITFKVVSMLVTDEDLYYKQEIYDHKYIKSTLSHEFSNLQVVGEILPHYLLDDYDKYIHFEFKNNTYFK